MSEATPRPWHMCGANNGRCICRSITDDRGVTIAVWYGDDRESVPGDTVACPNVEDGHANASLIVRAVNAHDDLVAMLRRLEWSGRNTCAVCGASTGNGHTDDCAIAALLAKVAKP